MKPRIALLTHDGDDSLCLGEDILLYFYDAGDCDRITWPNFKPHMLARTIFDCVETGDIPHNHGEFDVILPDDSIFLYLEHVK